MIIGGPQRRVEQFHRNFFQERGYRALQRGEAASGLPGWGLEIWWFFVKLPNVGSEELFGG